MELAHSLRLALGRVSRRLRRLYVDAESGPSFLELAVLHRLERQGPTHPGSMAHDEGVTSAAVAASLASLESRGLVVRDRDATDGRRIVVTLTGAGRKTLKGRDDACVAALGRALDGLTQREREVLGAAVPLIERLATTL
jgi:DNA-binding MarR family transcriptional regulator